MSTNPSPESSGATIDPELLAILRCPISRAPLVQQGDRLLCYESRKAYKIENGLPVMLVEEAEDIPESEIPAEHRDKPRSD